MATELAFRNKFYRWSPLRFILDRTIKNMVAETVDFLEGFISEEESIVDIGGGGGWISKEIQRRKNTKNLILDVTNLNQTDLPVTIYDGKNMPFTDNNFDTAFLICVLHHCEDPEKVLKEARRIVKKKVIIIENIAKNPLGRFALCCKDAFLNIGFSLLANSLKEIINLPFYFKTVPEWEKIFKKLDLKLVFKKEFHPPFSHHSVAFIVEK